MEMIIHKQFKTIDEILASKLEVRFLPIVQKILLMTAIVFRLAFLQ